MHFIGIQLIRFNVILVHQTFIKHLMEFCLGCYNVLLNYQTKKNENTNGEFEFDNEEQPPILTLKSTSSNKSTKFQQRGGSKYLNEISKDIVGIDSKLIAEQLTLMQFKLYYEIHAPECFNQAWKDNDKKYIIVPNIGLYIDQLKYIKCKKY